MQDEQEPTINEIEKAFASNKEGSAEQAQKSPQHNEPLVAWSASEYIAHHKNMFWYVALSGIIAVAAITVFMFTKDLVSSIVVVVAGLLFGIFALRQPAVRSYELRPSGIVISEKLFPYEMFKSFAIHENQAMRSIFLIPTKRFMPEITIYYPPEQESKIMKSLSNYLPLDDSEPDFIAKLMSRVRF